MIQNTRGDKKDEKMYNENRKSWLLPALFSGLLSSGLTALGAFVALGGELNAVKNQKVGADYVQKALVKHSQQILHPAGLKEFLKINQKVSTIEAKFEAFEVYQREQNTDIKEQFKELKNLIRELR